jgi:hypothetical protein
MGGLLHQFLVLTGNTHRESDFKSRTGLLVVDIPDQRRRLDIFGREALRRAVGVQDGLAERPFRGLEAS